MANVVNALKAGGILLVCFIIGKLALIILRLLQKEEKAYVDIVQQFFDDDDDEMQPQSELFPKSQKPLRSALKKRDIPRRRFFIKKYFPYFLI